DSRRAGPRAPRLPSGVLHRADRVLLRRAGHGLDEPAAPDHALHQADGGWARIRAVLRRSAAALGGVANTQSGLLDLQLAARDPEPEADAGHRRVRGPARLSRGPARLSRVVSAPGDRARLSPTGRPGPR